VWAEVTFCEVFEVQLGALGKVPLFCCEATAPSRMSGAGLGLSTLLHYSMNALAFLRGSQLLTTDSLGHPAMHPALSETAFLLSLAGQLQEKIGECCLA